MPTTPILGITQLTASQNNKEVTINDAIEALENATNAKLVVDFSSSTTVTLSDSQTVGNFIFEATGATAASILQIPTTINSNAVDRIFAVSNDSGEELTVQFVSAPGATVTIPDGETRLLAANDGTDVIVAAQPATTVTFLSLTDTPGTFSGQSGRFLSANVAENALEFTDAATFPSLTDNEGKYLVVNSAEDGVEWVDLSLVTTFLGLTDAPSSYSGQAGRYVVVTDGEDGVEFIDLPDLEAVEFIAAARWRINVVTGGSDPQIGFGEVRWLDQDGVNLVGSGTASASNEETGNEAEVAFDGNTDAGNGWLTEDDYVGDVWLEYDFGTPVTPRTLRAFPVNNFPEFSPLNFDIEYYNGATWISAGNRTPSAWDTSASQDFKVNGQPLSSVSDAPDDGNAYVRASGDWVIPSIDDLSDVDTTTAAPSDGDVLVWNDVDSTWEPGTIAGGDGAGIFKVRAASTAALTLSSDVENGDTLDGVTLATGDRILLKDQTAGEENGVYVVQASGAAVRATDADSSDELVNYAVLVSEGSANADKFFQCTTNAPITVDTTSLTWAEIASPAPTSIDDLIDVDTSSSAPTEGQALIWDDGDSLWIPGTIGSGGPSTTITEAGSSANLLATNAGDYQRWTATGAKTLTVQPEATEAISQDAEFFIANRAASGDLTIAEGTDVTVNVPSGGTLVLSPGMVVTLKRVAEDEFDLIGQTVPA